MKKTLLTVGAMVFGLSSGFCGEDMYASKEVDSKHMTSSIIEEDMPIFRAKEFSIDAFGSPVWSAQGDKYRQANGGGGGIGVNYFFTRYFGVGIEGYGLSIGNALGGVSGMGIARYPIEFNTWGIAPYIFGGGGGLWGGPNVGTGFAGGGFEVRLNHNWGIFADGRYMFGSDHSDLIMPRFGIRYAF